MAGWPWPSSAPRCGAGGWEVWDGRCVGKGVHGAPKTSKRRLTRALFGGRRIGSETDFVRQRAGRCAAPRATNALGMRPLTARLSYKACQPSHASHYTSGSAANCRAAAAAVALLHAAHRSALRPRRLCAAPPPPLSGLCARFAVVRYGFTVYAARGRGGPQSANTATKCI